MARLKGKGDRLVPYTPIPNDLIKSLRLDVYDKVIFMIIASLSPSFPSYSKIAEWSGIKKRDRIAKSLKNLERIGIITRYKKGRKIYYETHWDEKHTAPKGAELVTYGNQSTVPISHRRSIIGHPGELVSVTQGNSNKNNLKRTIKKISNFSNFENAEEKEIGEEENPKERKAISELISSSLKEIQNPKTSGDGEIPF